MNEFVLQTTSGQSLYGIIGLTSGATPGGFWNGGSLTIPTTPTYANFAQWFNEQLPGSGLYVGSMPAGITSPGRFTILARQCNSIAPHIGDPQITYSSGDITVVDWSSSKALSLNDVLGVGGGPVTIGSSIIPNSSTGNLCYETPAGVGIGGASVQVYYSTDWPINPGNVQATGVTATDGSWGPLFVGHGTYVAVFNKQGVSGPDVSPAFTV